MYKAAISEYMKQHLANERAKLVGDTIRVGLGGAVLGAGAGAIHQLMRRLGRKSLFEDKIRNDVAIPVPAVKKPLDEEELEAKAASTSLGQAASSLIDTLGSGLSKGYGTLKDMVSPRYSAGPDVMRNLQDHPWYYGGLISAGLAGGAGGFGIANSIGKKMNEEVMEQDIEDAKKEYEQALLGNYKKKASTEKSAFLGSVPGMYLTYALPAAIAGGTYGYYKNKEKNKRAIEAALKRRAALRELASPEPIHFVPVPTESEDK